MATVRRTVRFGDTVHEVDVEISDDELQAEADDAARLERLIAALQTNATFIGVENPANPHIVAQLRALTVQVTDLIMTNLRRAGITTPPVTEPAAGPGRSAKQ